MSHTVFLSTVTNEFGTFRRRLANLGQRTKKCHFRHQDDFFHRGVKALQKLVQEIEQSTVVVHIIGDQAGWSVPADQANSLLDQRPEFERRFPEVAAQARDGKLPATQWEAWLGLLLCKPLLSFQLQTLECELLQRLHIQRLIAMEECPQLTEDLDSLYDEVIGSLITTGILTQADALRPQQTSSSLTRRLVIAVGAGISLVGYSLPLRWKNDAGKQRNGEAKTDRFDPVSNYPLAKSENDIVLQAIDPTAPTHLEDLELLGTFYETAIPTAPKLLECLFFETNVEPDHAYVLSFSDVECTFPIFYAVISEEAAFAFEERSVLRLSQDLSNTDPDVKEVRFVTSESAFTVKCYFKFYYNGGEGRSPYSGRSLSLVQEPTTRE